jgi:peptide/nickel transport system substrate-binding protein
VPAIDQRRQAFNYVLVRNKLAAFNQSSQSCQVLPPSLFGYRRYCPHTIDPNPGGDYVGPNLAKAKQLVAASGTKGETVTIWT